MSFQTPTGIRSMFYLLFRLYVYNYIEYIIDNVLSYIVWIYMNYSANAAWAINLKKT